MSNDYYVYAFYNEKWHDYFYIGKGRGNRIDQTNDRSLHVKAILNNYPCRRIKVIDNISESVALEYERHLKSYAREQGWPLIDYETTLNQRAGIERAKAEGKYKGRKAVEIEDSTFTEQYTRYMNREITKTELAKILKVSRPTLDKIIKIKQCCK